MTDFSSTIGNFKPNKPMKIPIKTLIASCLFLPLVNSDTMARDMGGRSGSQGSASAGGYSGSAVGGHSVSLPGRSSFSLPGGSIARSLPSVSQYPMIQARPVIRPNVMPVFRPQLSPDA